MEDRIIYDALGNQQAKEAINNYLDLPHTGTFVKILSKRQLQ